VLLADGRAAQPLSDPTPRWRGSRICADGGRVRFAAEFRSVVGEFVDQAVEGGVGFSTWRANAPVSCWQAAVSPDSANS
jgi:hypothetical protein